MTFNAQSVTKYLARFKNVAAVLGAVGLIVLLAGQSGDLKKLLGTTSDTKPVQVETATDRAIRPLEAEIANGQATARTRVSLAEAYLQKVRESADTSFYGKVDEVLGPLTPAEAAGAEVLALQAGVANGRHDFVKSLALAQQALTANPDRAATYGLIGDAQIELGQYDAAVQSFQQMINKKPESGALNRVGYVREIYGDISNAKLALQSAVSAGSPFPENTAFTQVELGKLQLRDNLDEAEATFEQAIVTVPNYAPALEGLGRVAVARDDYKEAEMFFKKAYEALPTAQHATNLGDLAAVQGDSTKASQQYQLAKIAFDKAQAGGVNIDVERALFLAEHDRELDTALALAETGIQTRPSILGADALAWSLYKKQRYPEAQVQIKSALRLGEHDPLILYHAGMIAAKNNDPAEAKRLLSRALELNPHFGITQPRTARETLATL